ncbi:MAG TPA: DUF2256 domain-containing protein [Opitutae bacterium]|nr:DUF2256 domain-containing protein [Opitutae bacterium]
MGSKVRTESKACIHCGRVFENRKKWRSRHVWDSVLHCSQKCAKLRRRKKRAERKEQKP